jgi:hypothetical protein
LKSSHPPTGATTLIVSLGLLRTPREMVMLMIGVILLTVVGLGRQPGGRGSGAGLVRRMSTR